jgi:hypothetical protein
MKKKFLYIGIFCSLLLVVMLVLFWLSPSNQSLNERKNARPSDFVQPPPSKDLPPVVSPEKLKYESLFNTPISFFGKVVDQFGTPVPAVAIRVNINNNPQGEGDSLVIQSDASGLFSIEGQKGLALYIEVSKENYHRVVPDSNSPGSYGGFAYGLNQGRGIHVPDPSKPVIFVLRKPAGAEALIHQPKRRPRLPKDGSVVRLDVGPNAGSHFLELQCWTDDQNQGAEGKYDWRFRLSAPQGGLVVREGSSFEAPLDGYKRVIEMSMSKSNDSWSRHFGSDFFVRFDDGIYARISLSITAFGAHYAVFESYLNPKIGSRNLEWNE